MAFFGNRLKHVACKLWDATDSNFDFPERSDPNLKIAELDSRPNVGLAFSGGGTRSASATLGQLRGLTHLNLLKNVRYISCVSGGSWTCVPFSYLPNGITDKTFLGQVVPPQELTLQNLQTSPQNRGAHAIANSGLFDNFLKHSVRFAGDETFSRALGDTFLHPLGIDSLKRFFTLNQKSVDNILTRNSKMNENDFYQVRSGRPFLIVGSTLVRPKNKFHFETTPLYAGIRVLHAGAGSKERDIGGGYLEPFGFDSEEPEDPPGADTVVKVRLGGSRHRYTLSDVIGTSGAPSSGVLAKLSIDWLGLPEFKYWPAVNPTNVSAREYTFGDGGLLENLGIMPLLARKVDRIVVFVNTKHELKGGGKGQINDSIPPLFGQTPDFKLNRVFSESKYQPLVQGLLDAKEAEGTVLFKDTYTVQENLHYGIEGGWDVEILWVYNERVKAWESELAPEVKSEVSQLIGTGSPGGFPHYKTFFQNFPAIIDLSSEQVSLLAELSCANIISNKRLFEDTLNQSDKG